MKTSTLQPRDGFTHSRGASAATLSLTLFLSAALASPAWAQNFNTDARIIGMGGSDQSNDSTSLSEETNPYKSIGLPLGLFQLWNHKDAFKPDDKVNFNPLMAIEDLSNPLHFTLGRDSETQGDLIVKDLVNGTVDRDLNAYKGFTPKSPLASQGLFSPDFGKTIRILKVGKLYQGIYVGAGPYLSASTDFVLDPALLDAWSGASSGIPANATLHLDDTTSGQAALAITGGYRARFAAPNALKTSHGADRDGVYVSANYHYLRGYHYDTDLINVRFDTDSTGQIALTPPSQPPVLVDRTWSKSGTGRALDFGTNVVTGPWDFNFGVDGVANQIVWDGLVHEQFTLSDDLNGMDFVKTTLAAPGGTITVKLPVRYSGGATFRADKWTVRGQVARGIDGREFHAGGEYRLGIIDIRGGGRYARNAFNPMGGIGLNLTKHFGIDSALFTTTSNVEETHRAALALSLRFQ